MAFQHNPKVQYHYIPGYGDLADFISSDEDHSTSIYRRFDRLSARNLLYFQSKLAELEARQVQFDIEDAKDNEDIQKLDIGRHIREHAQDWQTFEGTRSYVINSSAGMISTQDTNPSSDDRWKKRLELAMDIRETLKDYRKH